MLHGHVQRHELWALHGDWVRDTKPDFGAGTAERFRAASQITQEQVRGQKHLQKALGKG